MSSELPPNFTLCEIVWTVGAVEVFDPLISTQRCPMRPAGSTVWEEKLEAERYLSQRAGKIHVEGKGEVPAAIYPVGLPSHLGDCVRKEGPFLVLIVDGLLYPCAKERCLECERKDKVLKRLDGYLQGLADGLKLFSRREMGFARKDVQHARLGSPEPPLLYVLRSPSEILDEEFFSEKPQGASNLHPRPQTSDGETLGDR